MSIPYRESMTILDTLEGAAYFTTFDLASGYWHIGMDSESAAKSAFITHKGHHEFVRMPFGMCNAPATFQRLMERLMVILADLLWKSCFVYIDYVLICSRNFKDHLTHVEQVLQRLQNAGLRLKAKCFSMRRSPVPRARGDQGWNTSRSGKNREDEGIS